MEQTGGEQGMSGTLFDCRVVVNTVRSLCFAPVRSAAVMWLRLLPSGGCMHNAVQLY